MIILGVILLLIGIFAKISILTTIGVILLVIGAILFIAGSVGRPVAGRRYWYLRLAPRGAPGRGRGLRRVPGRIRRSSPGGACANTLSPARPTTPATA